MSFQDDVPGLYPRWFDMALIFAIALCTAIGAYGLGRTDERREWVEVACASDELRVVLKDRCAGWLSP